MKNFSRLDIAFCYIVTMYKVRLESLVQSRRSRPNDARVSSYKATAVDYVKV